MTATTWPCSEMSSGAAIRFTLKWQMFGLLLMASHIILVKQTVYALPIMFIFLAWLYYNAPLTGLIVYLQLLIYQNLMIGLLAYGMEREPTFVVLQGTNFGAICVMAIIAWVRLAGPTWRDLRPLLRMVVLCIGLALIYMGIGAVQEGITSASIYFRSTTAMIFAVVVGLDVGRLYGFRTVAIAFVTSAALSMILGYIEIIAPETYYDATNAVQFEALKTLNDPKFDVFYSAKDIIFHNQVTFFNVSGSDSGITQTRFIGTVMHPISYAYIIAATALLALAINYDIITLLLLPLLMLTSVKGANLLFICSVLLWFTLVVTRSRRLLIVSGMVLMAGYIGFGLAFGEENGDYHVLGFLGGVNSLMTAPWGHGIGVGGNLSANAGAGFNWQKFQQSGAATFALESAVGVLFYQMGVASIAVFGVFIMLLRMGRLRIAALGKRIENRHSLMFIVLATVAVNGVFQEEAYAPTAAGLITLLCAVIIANGDRPVNQLSWVRSLVTSKAAHV